jgi:hypothetical protein
MFTVEFESDAAIITTLDEHDAFDDVQVVIADDDTVYMRQFSEELEEHQLLYMSYQQFLDIVAALSKTKGMYYVERT